MIRQLDERKIWLTADQHFGHGRIIAYCGRPFRSVEAMDATMLRRWNDRVGKQDIVIHLGDFALAPRGRIAELTARLHGEKYLVRGNHDHSVNVMRECGWNVLLPGMEWLGYALWHEPTPYLPRAGCFCGHVHEKWLVRNGWCNVGVDQWEFAPVEMWKAVNALLKGKEDERKIHHEREE